MPEQEQVKYEQVSAVVDTEGRILGKVYTRHGDAIRYLNLFKGRLGFELTAQRFNLIPDESFEYKDK